MFSLVLYNFDEVFCLRYGLRVIYIINKYYFGNNNTNSQSNLDLYFQFNGIVLLTPSESIPLFGSMTSSLAENKVMGKGSKKF